ncbi:hypothetical protein CCZ01_06705 [Helicobacter monodelphidis]|uniref:hypothetical protein n=1 Tax=Helicobacter sp. 15-1451 TaxID=2004995 RepID=UPI000DCDFE3E|nr:hypothetical protein [Helicobacter sp. 15-1451]RAX57261.1 hypothetical protein CCZ01_06705 [Helicobacter sp. 15-1451]
MQTLKKCLKLIFALYGIIGIMVFYAWAEPLCLSEAQIEAKQYAVKIIKEYGGDEAGGESGVLKYYSDATYVKANSWGVDYEVIELNETIKSIQILGHKNDKSSVDDWFPHGYGGDNGANWHEMGKVVFEAHSLPKGSKILVRAATPGSTSVGGVVYLTLKNGVKITHIITEDGLGSDYFYDKSGEIYSECHAYEIL